MARPSRTPLNSSESGWVARFNALAAQGMDAPAPLALYADKATLDAVVSPKLDQDCLSMVGTSGSGRIYTSDGVDHKELDRERLTYIPDFDPPTTSVADVRAAFNALLADMITKGYMASS